MTRKNKELPPHWILVGNVKCCSICGYPFPADVQPSIDAAFAEHRRKFHKPGQTSEDVNQTAARIVGETTEER